MSKVPTHQQNQWVGLSTSELKYYDTLAIKNKLLFTRTSILDILMDGQSKQKHYNALKRLGGYVKMYSNYYTCYRSVFTGDLTTTTNRIELRRNLRPNTTIIDYWYKLKKSWILIFY